MTEERTLRPADFPPGLIAVPAQEQMWTMSAQAIFAELRQPPGSLMYADYANSHSIARKRNVAITKFLERPELKWICFLDSDMVPHPASLLLLLEAGQDIVGGFCFKRGGSYGSTAFRRELNGQHTRALHPETLPNSLVEVDHTGAALLMVQRHVIEALPAPWFDHPEPGVKEDVFFCDKATAAGFKIFVHTSVTPGHVGVVSVDVEFARRNYNEADT
jgi:hypothetical protein